MTAALILGAFVVLLLVLEKPAHGATRDELAQARREAQDRRDRYAGQKRRRFARYGRNWSKRVSSGRMYTVPFRAEGGR